MLMTRVFYYSLTTEVYELDFDYCPTCAHGNLYAAVGFKCMWQLCIVKMEFGAQIGSSDPTFTIAQLGFTCVTEFREPCI